MNAEDFDGDGKDGDGHACVGGEEEVTGDGKNEKK
jgi:hypothetical protein